MNRVLPDPLMLIFLTPSATWATSMFTVFILFFTLQTAAAPYTSSRTYSLTGLDCCASWVRSAQWWRRCCGQSYGRLQCRRRPPATPKCITPPTHRSMVWERPLSSFGCSESVIFLCSWKAALAYRQMLSVKRWRSLYFQLRNRTFCIFATSYDRDEMTRKSKNISHTNEFWNLNNNHFQIILSSAFLFGSMRKVALSLNWRLRF